MQKPSLFHSYLITAADLIREYDSSTPLNYWLKKYFAQHKKYGGRDRKQIAHLCYCYYRLGKALPETDWEERTLFALFLCSDKPSPILENLKVEWNANIALPLQGKLRLVHYSFSVSDIFSFKEALSDGVDHEQLSASMLIQPDMFLRIRPGKKNIVLKQLQEHSIEFRQVSENCLAFHNSIKLEGIVAIDKDVVIQDYSSQRIGEFLSLVNSHRSLVNSASSIFSVWDCCAASGGKSILAYDMLPGIALTVSDVRPSILHNLHKRFREAGIKKYDSFVADLAVNWESSIVNRESSRVTSDRSSSVTVFNFIICDVPCSGSGTWARTPEQLYFFSEEKINYYAVLQKKIVNNVIPKLKDGGYFLYITCSVFREENEAVVEFIVREHNLKLIRQELLKGYGMKADSMFAALFRRTDEGIDVFDNKKSTR